MAVVLIRAVRLFAQVLTWLLVARAAMSWFARGPYSTAGKIYSWLIQLTEPMVAPCRKLLDKLGLGGGMLDFSVLLAFLLIEFLAALIVRLILLFA